MVNRKNEKRWDQHGELRCMADADGYVMVRRPRAIPTAMSVKDWDRMARIPFTKYLELGTNS